MQIARSRGARVTAVCGPGNVELMESLGVERVLDYTVSDFTTEDERYDVIFGVNGYRSLGQYRRCLAPGGRYVMIGGGGRQLFEALLLGRLRFLFSGKTATTLTIDGARRADDLATLAGMLDAGELTPEIEHVFSLDQAREAITFVEQGHVRGKVIFRIAGSGA